MEERYLRWLINRMKAKTTCPHCEHHIVVDVPDDSDHYEITCPSCKMLFMIKRGTDQQKDCEGDCTWEECGEPRKTVLSKLRRHTNRPVIISFLLLAAGVLGIFTAVFFVGFEGRFVEELGVIAEILNSFVGQQVLIAILVFVFSIFAILGAFFAYLRKYYWITVISAVLGILAVGFFIGFIVSLVALVLLILARDEFDHEATCRTF